MAPDPPDPDPSEDGEYASLEEARQAIAGLSQADLAKLGIAAKAYSRRLGVRGADLWGDLLNEALAKTLEGDRRWRHVRVTIVHHLDQVMSSLSSHAVGVARRERAAVADMDPREVRDPVGSSDPALSSVETAIVSREEIERFLDHFQGDTDALRVLACRARGMRGHEIQEALGISKTQLATVNKRILRTYVRLMEA